MPMRAPSPSGEVLARNSTSWLVAAILLVSHAAVYGQVVRYVDASRPDDSGNGLSWATADKTLQAALAVAVSGDEIWVKQGIYKPDQGPGQTPGDRTATFQLIDGVEIYGGFAGTETLRSQRDWVTDETILDGDLSGNDSPLACTTNAQCSALGGLCFSGACISPQNNAENSYHVVTGSFNDATAVLDGFTIRGGNADGTGALLEDLGAGIFNNSGSPTLSNCRITGNSAESAGGGIVNLRQTGNPNAEPFIRNCMVIGNAGALGGGMYAAGGASVAKVSNCTFMANVASGSSGGGAMVMLNAPPVVFNSAFIGNVASTGDGGAVANLTAGSSQFTNCTFSGNTAGDHGGAFYISTGSPVLTNCTFIANTAPAGAGGGLRAIGGSGVVRNSIFWGNTDDGSLDASAQIDGITPSYSIVQFFVSGGTGNSGSDPLLVDFDGQDNVVGTADDNLRLSVGSAAIDAANSTLVPLDTLDLDDDANTSERTPLDLASELRFRDNAATADSGVADPPDYPVVDMGAYEFPGRLYVDADATGGDNGSTWDDAFVHLRDALAEATTGMEIWVAAGTYRPHLKSCATVADCGGPPNVCAPVGLCIWDQIRAQTFQLQSGVALYGGFAGDETELSQRDVDANPTILSGDLADDDAPVPCAQNSPDCDSAGAVCDDGVCIIRGNNAENALHVVTGTGTDATAALDGFIITGGNADGPCCEEESNGGGLIAWPGTPTVRNCTFARNSAEYGGGAMWAEGGAILVEHCVFTKNHCTIVGGGIFLSAPSGEQIHRCTFEGNYAGIGGGIVTIGGSPVISQSLFSGNIAGNDGGGIHNLGNSGSALVRNCVFSGNRASTYGGGINNADGNSPILINCSFSLNVALLDGGGIYNAPTGVNSPELINCVLWNNSDASGTTPTAQVHTESGAPIVNYSLVQGGWSGAGSNNVNADPLFFDPDGADNIIGTVDDDLRLRTGSPAIDAGDTTALPMDTLDLDGDANTTEYIPFDLAGNPRLFDDPYTLDTGVADPIVVDMGAYEYFTDCNGNGIEDSVDIAQSTSEDCDWDGGGPNGIPDECDIAACPERTCTFGAPCASDVECGGDACSDPAFAACDDCNLNGKPDGCDIALGSSLDVAPTDGVPDECVNFTGGCNPPSNEWSCGGNWTLAGDYPDNDVDTYSVVLNGTADAVCLDVPVEIDSLNLIGGASLQVTQPDPPCDGAAAARGPSVTTLDVVADGGLVVQDSSLTVSADNVINVSGSMIIGPGGSYTLDASATSLSSAVLNVSELRIIGSDCGSPPCPDGGMMDLSDQMEVHTTGDLIVDGSLANGDCGLALSAAARSFHTPPIKRVRESAAIDVGGDLVYAGAANVVCESSEPVIVGGDFQNESVRPDCFDYLSGSLRLAEAAAHVFEVAAVDVGPVDALAEAQFAMGSLEIGAGASVTFSDNFDNDLSGQGSCTEALYVGTLTLETNASVVARNCRIYYQTLSADPSAAISTEGCGEVRPLQNPAEPAAVVGPGGEVKNRFVSFTVPLIGAGSQTAVRIELTSLHHPAGPPNAPDFSSFEGQYRYLNAIRDGANNPVYVCPDSPGAGTSFACAKLGCAPEYRDWAGIFGGAVVHVTGDGVVPSSQYAVTQLAASCAGNETSCTAVSAELTVATERWGNVDGSPVDGAPAALDIGRVVDKVRDLSGAFTKSRCQLREATPNPYAFAVNAQDIARIVDAVKGQPYPFTISVCP